MDVESVERPLPSPDLRPVPGIFQPSLSTLGKLVSARIFVANEMEGLISRAAEAWNERVDYGSGSILDRWSRYSVALMLRRRVSVDMI